MTLDREALKLRKSASEVGYLGSSFRGTATRVNSTIWAAPQTYI